MRAAAAGGPRDGRARLGPRRLARRPRPHDAPRRSRGDYGRAHAEYLRIFGVPARVERRAGLDGERPLARGRRRSGRSLYTSDTRGGAPFFPRGGRAGLPHARDPDDAPDARRDARVAASSRGDADQRAFFRDARSRGTEVHTIHAEVEGRSKAALFAADPRRLAEGGRALRSDRRPRARRPAHAAGRFRPGRSSARRSRGAAEPSRPAGPGRRERSGLAPRRVRLPSRRSSRAPPCAWRSWPRSARTTT